jgi:putative redox protein
MTTELVRLDWLAEQVFVLRDHNDFPLVMTQPMGVSGADLLPLSLLGCAAWDILAILQKQRQPVTRFEATAESQREEQPPWRFLSIRLRYRLAGPGLEEAAIQRAIRLTEEKYCSVYATLRQAIEIVSDYEILP